MKLAMNSFPFTISPLGGQSYVFILIRGGCQLTRLDTKDPIGLKITKNCFGMDQKWTNNGQTWIKNGPKIRSNNDS